MVFVKIFRSLIQFAINKMFVYQCNTVSAKHIYIQKGNTLTRQKSVSAKIIINTIVPHHNAAENTKVPQGHYASIDAELE